MKVNMFATDTEDMKNEELGEYHPYDYGSDTEDRPQKVGDLVILSVYPHFDDIMKQFEYGQKDKYPPDYYVITKVTRFTEDGGFFCKLITTETECRKNN
ncbi:MAG: hypothetical protein V1769_00080 [Thermoplasmatota archaeon]